MFLLIQYQRTSVDQFLTFY